MENWTKPRTSNIPTKAMKWAQIVELVTKEGQRQQLQQTQRD